MNLSSHIEWVRYSETLGHTNHISNSYTNCTAKKNKKQKNKKQKTNFHKAVRPWSQHARDVNMDKFGWTTQRILLSGQQDK